MNDLRSRIESALEYCRPFLRVDEGDIELVSIDEVAGIVDVRFLGACATCPLKIMTLRAGIERAIISKAPEIKRIEEVVS
ncbi:MAG: NifU family protein [Bacteroidota bacterium]|nr:NifU family protein [Bacteroidota bacterium]MDP4229279.1 NifU family protein [Bacteroidota bacterium]